MVNPSNSSFIKFQDNFNLGYILLGNEIEKENFIYNYFNQKNEKLKNYNSRLEYKKSFFNEKKDQTPKNQNLLEKENSRLSNEIKTLNTNNDNNQKIFQNKINILNDKIEKKNEEIKDFGLKFEYDKSENSFYDIIINIISNENLNNEGGIVKYLTKEKNREYYIKVKDDQTIIVGVIGNANKGKSFLKKLSEIGLPKGFNLYGEEKNHKLTILDSAGQETPLLKINPKTKETKKDPNTPESNNEMII
jgi:hypothetical protein